MWEKCQYRKCQKCGTVRNISIAKFCPVCLFGRPGYLMKESYTRESEPWEKVICKNCGVEFDGLKCAKRKFCSTSCASKYNGKKNKPTKQSSS